MTMTKKIKFKIGDRVRYYAVLNPSFDGIVCEIHKSNKRPTIYVIKHCRDGESRKIATVYPDRLTLITNGLEKAVKRAKTKV